MYSIKNTILKVIRWFQDCFYSECLLSFYWKFREAIKCYNITSVKDHLKIQREREREIKGKRVNEREGKRVNDRKSKKKICKDLYFKLNKSFEFWRKKILFL